MGRKNIFDNFGMPSTMGEVMAALLVVVDAWFEIASERDPGQYQPSDRIEVLGQLVRLISHRFDGLSRLPSKEDVALLVTGDTVGLRLRSQGPVPRGTRQVERQLADYGFTIETLPGSGRREVLVTCSAKAQATVLPFPGGAAMPAETPP